MRIVTFDIETIPPPGETKFETMTQLITVVGIHDSETDTYEAFEVSEFPRLWKILEHTDILVGYNSDHFDIPILNKYYPGDLMKIQSLDLLKEIYGVLGRRIRLDSVAEGTLGEGKSGNGLEAQKWWYAGDKERVKTYCLKDVEITKRVLDYALEKRGIKFKELGKVKELALDTSKWLAGGASPLTHTLGF
jgi:DEAD/DEAH box helicase domain-containing protein